MGSLLRRTFPPQPEPFPARSSGRVGQEERPQKSPGGGEANEYRLAVMNERHKGGIEGQLKKKSIVMVANRNIMSTYFAYFLL